MEEFSRNCGFILTCNFKNRIIEPLHSRCSVIDFKIGKKDMAKLAIQFLKRVTSILTTENVINDKAVVAEVINKHFPDWRRVLNELQRYSATGRIDSGILRNKSTETMEELLEMIKLKRFNDVRKWVGENSDIDSATLYRSLYDMLPMKLRSPSSVADAIIVLAEYEYKEAFVANPEINRMAALVTLMAELSDWK
jgi:DNA polymerase III delta prime subunit